MDVLERADKIIRTLKVQSPARFARIMREAGSLLFDRYHDTAFHREPVGISRLFVAYKRKDGGIGVALLDPMAAKELYVQETTGTDVQNLVALLNQYNADNAAADRVQVQGVLRDFTAQRFGNVEVLVRLVLLSNGDPYTFVLKRQANPSGDSRFAVDLIKQDGGVEFQDRDPSQEALLSRYNATVPPELWVTDTMLAPFLALSRVATAERKARELKDRHAVLFGLNLNQLHET